MRSEEAAQTALAEAERAGQGVEAAQTALRLSIYYETAREKAGEQLDPHLHRRLCEPLAHDRAENAVL